MEITIGLLPISDYLWLEKHGDFIIIAWVLALVIALIMTYFYKKRQEL